MRRYKVIIADPAWSYNNAGINGAAEKHYDVQSDEEIAALDVKSRAEEDAVLFLWATWPKLDVAMRSILPAWGFDYVTGFPWIKLSKELPQVDLFGELKLQTAWGQGWWVRGVSEPLLIARRGKPERPDMFLGLISDLFSSTDGEVRTTALVSPRFEHSRKPDNLYEIAESLPGPYLEMNARRARPGWDLWGNHEDITSIDL